MPSMCGRGPEAIPMQATFLVQNLGLFAAEWVLFAAEFAVLLLLLAVPVAAGCLRRALLFRWFFSFGLDAAGSQSLFVAILVVFCSWFASLLAVTFLSGAI
ncbi:hypothetical protein U1Q18_005990 [Sarracenia purpurea var. burkii]